MAKNRHDDIIQPRRSLLEIVALQLKILFFCADEEELLTLGKREYFFGITLVWLAGIARFSNDPAASPFARSGVESVCYVFFLAMFLWVLMALIGARNFKFGRLIIFICMTAPPSFLFAIPLKSLVPAFLADQISAFIYLGTALWRVALFAWFTHKIAELTPVRIAVAIFPPLAAMICLVAGWEDVKTKYGNVGGVRRELRKTTPKNWAAPAGSSQMLAGPSHLPFEQFMPAAPWGGNPNQGTASQSSNFPQSSPQGKKHKRNVTAGQTGWLSSYGEQLAEKPDKSPVGIKMNLSKPPAYQETVNTPQGPVEIYWTVGTPGSAVPPGFEEVTVDDPVQAYRNPTAKILSPLATICFFGSIPAGLAYFVFIFLRPKRRPQETPASDDAESDSDDEDDEEDTEP